jgi:hypothetical protein
MPQLIIYCDESTQKGKFYSNFYGGALFEARVKDQLELRLQSAKGKCLGEMKWEKISEYNEDDYRGFIDAIMDLVRDNLLKIRVMFTHNIHVSLHKSDESLKYSKLYYQFVKHAFGLRYCNPDRSQTFHISLFLDQFPHTPARFVEFQTYMSSLSELKDFRSAHITISKDNIIDVVSGHHIILQAVDVVLGAIQFKLNDKHLEKLPGQNMRGKRTRAKERVYKHLNTRLRDLHPRFNIGVTTGQNEGPHVRWTHAYRHWSFIPKASKVDVSKGKRKKKAPLSPT